MKNIGRSCSRPRVQNKVLSPNELIREMHHAQRLENRAWTVLAVAASLVLGLSLLLA